MTTVLNLLESQFLKTPDKVAITLLHNGEIPAGETTYRQLVAQAQSVAELLSKAGIGFGERVLLVYPEGVEFLPVFLGCLFAGVIAIPTPVPDAFRSKRALPHMKAVGADANAVAVLTTQKLKDELLQDLSFPMVTTDDALANSSRFESEPGFPKIDPDHLAYLQYTSGSTGTPKGVMISHANVVANLANFNIAVEDRPDCVNLTWMPHTHDFGLVFGLLRPLMVGTPTYIMPPSAYLRRPIRWLNAISKFRVTLSAAATFAYKQCLQYAGTEACADLDLSTWRFASVGAEPIPAALLEEFAEKYAPYGFRRDAFCPGYGMAEAVLMLTTNSGDNPLVTRTFSFDGRVQTLTGCGMALGDTRLLIVDPDTSQPVPDGSVGEIWATGRSIGKGYWQRETETREAFGNILDGVPYLKTGDLGLIYDGQIFITGRLKDMLIVNGQNYYPSDIEWSVEAAHPMLKSGLKAAFAVNVSDELRERLVLVCEVEPREAREVNLNLVVQAIRKQIAVEFSLPVYAITILRRGALSRTPSGKVQRRQARELWLRNELESLLSWQLEIEQLNRKALPRTGQDATSATVMGPCTPQEEQLVAIWRELLQIEHVEMEDDFFNLGGDSLLAVSMIAHVERDLECKVALKDFVFEPTISHLATLIQGAYGQMQNTNSPVKLKDSSGQSVERIEVEKGITSNSGRFSDSLTDEENRILSNLYDKVGTLEMWREQIAFQTSALHTSRFERFIKGLSVFLAVPLLKLLTRYPQVQQRYYQYEMWQIEKFYDTLDTPVDVNTMRNYSLFYNLLVRYGFDTRKAERERKRDSETYLTGMEHLDEARRRGKGVILAFHHTLAQAEELEQFVQSGLVKMIVHTVAVHTKHFNLPMERCMPILFARFLELATDALKQGEVVFMAPDANIGNGSAYSFPIHGRMFRIFPRFAELALLTGATVLPVMHELGPGMPSKWNILPPIDPGDATLPHAARIEMMCAQYAALLEDSWRRMPWIVPLYIMWRQLLQNPKRPNSAQRTLSREQIRSRYVAPVNSTQRQIVELWQEMLGLAPIGIEDDFFELGGDTLSALRLIALIEYRLDRRPSMTDFVRVPTIANLAQSIKNSDNHTTESTLDSHTSATKIGDNGFLETPPADSGSDVGTTISSPGARVYLASLTEEEVRKLTNLCDDIGRKETLWELEGWYAPKPMKSVLEHSISRLPAPIAARLLTGLTGNDLLRQKYYRHETWLISQFLTHLDTPVNRDSMLSTSLLNNLLVRYGFDLRRLERAPSQSVSLIGWEKVEEAKKQGKGVILVSHRSLAISCQVKQLIESRLIDAAMVSMEWHARGVGLSLEKCIPALSARYFELAQEILGQKGVMFILPEANTGVGEAYVQPFHGRMCRFFTGFAELALMTGAPVLPVLGEMGPGIPVTLNIMPPIDPGDTTLSHALRIEQMCSQFVGLVEDNWRRMPWSVPLEQMWEHIQRPEVPK